MGDPIVCIDRQNYDVLCNHLLSVEPDKEQVAFSFARVAAARGTLELQIAELFIVERGQFEFHSGWHVELVDSVRPALLRRATELDASIVEFHSHLHSPAKFSGSDVSGFAEWVPHVRWRLGGKPYVAIVLTRSDLDALAWVGLDGEPQRLQYLTITTPFRRGKKYRPTDKTIREMKRGRKIR